MMIVPIGDVPQEWVDAMVVSLDDLARSYGIEVPDSPGDGVAWSVHPAGCAEDCPGHG